MRLCSRTGSGIPPSRWAASRGAVPKATSAPAADGGDERRASSHLYFSYWIHYSRAGTLSRRQAERLFRTAGATRRGTFSRAYQTKSMCIRAATPGLMRRIRGWYDTVAVRAQQGVPWRLTARMRSRIIIMIINSQAIDGVCFHCLCRAAVAAGGTVR